MSAAKPRCRYFLNTRFCPLASSEALKFGNCAMTFAQARAMKASGVSLMPRLAARSLSDVRSFSSSVMSASSCCVTCGMLTQAACSRVPEIFWMRPSGLTSTGPKAAKSTSGTRGSAAPADSARGGPASAFFTKALTSSSLMRPLSPLPVTRARSTPSSRAKRRTDGLACAPRMSGSAAPAAGAVMRCVASCAGAGAAAAGAGRAPRAARTACWPLRPATSRRRRPH